MAFKLVEKSCGTSAINDNEVSVNNYGMTFGKDVSKRFEGFKSCEVYLDKDNRKVGLKPTNNSIIGFRVSADSNGKGRRAISGSWSKRLPKRRFVVTYDDDMIILNDCDVADKKPKIKVE